MYRKIILVIFLTAAAVFIAVKSSNAYYTDQVTSTGNSFTAGTWEAPEASVSAPATPVATPTPTVTPTPELTVETVQPESLAAD